MNRIKINLPDKFDFSTEIPIRITDLNYGGHLGNDSLLSIIHEARMRYLNKLGFSEMDCGGSSIIMTDSAIEYKSEGFYGDVLIAEVRVLDIDKMGCDFYYRFTNKNNMKEIARAKTGILFYDYSKKKLMHVPDKFVQSVNN